MVEKTVHLRITGRVQGVCFRAWTQQSARELGLKGWVRNRKDGAVEAVFSGSDANVSTMLTACLKGPSAAQVEHIEHLEAVTFSGEGFSVLPTE